MPHIHQNHSDFSLLGRRLRSARKDRRVGQAELATLVGCAIRSVYRAEAGQGDVGCFLRLAAALGMELASRSLPPGPDLGSRLRVARKTAGLSRAEIGLRSETSATTVAAIESGGLGHLAALERVARAIGTPLTLVPHGRADCFFTVHASSRCESWTTPQEVLDRLYRVIGGAFDLDPCSPRRGSRVLARTTYDELDDGLSRSWRGQVFMNPPYGRTIQSWTTKARSEALSGRATLIVGLVPARTDTAWWHSDVGGHADIYLLKGRLKFGDGLQSAPFPSALVLWNAAPGHRLAMSVEFPTAIHVPCRLPPQSPVAEKLAAD